jgi:nucleoside-diphosphate-sugar epimerase
VRETELQWCILRGGLLYGPGTGREEQWREQVLSGEWRMPGDGGELMSLIQATDLARAVVLAAEAAPPRSLLNVVDDRPATQRELFSYLAARLGAAAPGPGGERYLPSLGCSNARLKMALGWLPAFPTFLSGLEQM